MRCRLLANIPAIGSGSGRTQIRLIAEHVGEMIDLMQHGNPPIDVRFENPPATSADIVVHAPHARGRSDLLANERPAPQVDVDDRRNYRRSAKGDQLPLTLDGSSPVGYRAPSPARKSTDVTLTQEMDHEIARRRFEQRFDAVQPGQAPEAVHVAPSENEPVDRMDLLPARWDKLYQMQQERDGAYYGRRKQTSIMPHTNSTVHG